MSDSSLVTKFIAAYSGNYTKNRASYGKIQEITIHHAAGNMTIDSLGKLWQTVGRNGSSHYGVQGSQVGQYVKESDIAWTNGHWASNCRAVTIETSNSGGAPNWPVADNTLDTLIKLVADIALRNGLVPLVYGKNLTWHSMYAATACPGPYLKGKLQYIVDEANKIINAGGSATGGVEYMVEYMKVLKITGAAKGINVQGFGDFNTSAVAANNLADGYYAVNNDNASTNEGFKWCVIYYPPLGRTLAMPYGGALDDRCALLDAQEPKDVIAAILKQDGGSGGISQAEYDAVKKQAEAAEKGRASAEAKIKAAQTALA